MLFVTLLLASAGITWARPNESIDTHNVVVVPPNCPPGQELINGICRDVWIKNDIVPANTINVPPNCRPGQELINGQCRDVWRKIKNEYPIDMTANYNQLDTHNVVSVPPNCDPGQQLVNGQCRDIWRSGGISPANVVNVPPNCPLGQEFINGICRDVWLKNGLKSIQVSKLFEAIFNKLESFGYGENVKLHADGDNDSLQKLSQNIYRANKNIINVPNQCPVGFKPDALGICREIFG